MTKAPGILYVVVALIAAGCDNVLGFDFLYFKYRSFKFLDFHQISSSDKIHIIIEIKYNKLALSIHPFVRVVNSFSKKYAYIF